MIELIDLFKDPIEKQAGRVYPSLSAEMGGYTKEICTAILKEYYAAYEDTWGEPHPPIEDKDLADIMRRLPAINRKHLFSRKTDVIPQFYPHMIEHYIKHHAQKDSHIKDFMQDDNRYAALLDSMIFDSYSQ